jgi:probable rRNA maturation factor
MIRIRNQQRKIRVNLPRIQRTIKRILKILTFPYDPELSILLVNDKKMEELNSKYRGIKKSTDVLSFPVEEEKNHNFHPVVLGDIVISIPAVLRQARERRVTLYDELNTILIHSILHLYGYTHYTETKAEKMRRKEKEIASSLRSSQ